VQNFKSIKNINDNGIELKPLTIITGPNSSGKSNLLEAIFFVSQIAYLPREHISTLESVLQHGPFVSYPNVTYITFCKKEKFPLKIEMFFSLSHDERSKIKEKVDKLGYGLSYIPEKQETKQTIYLGNEPFVETFHTRTETATANKFIHPKILTKYPPRESADQILSHGIFNPVDTVVSESERFEVGETLRKARVCIDLILQKMRRTFFISTLRGAIPNAGKAEGTPVWVGKQGEDLLNLLSLIFSKREYLAKAERIKFWAKNFGLSSMFGGWWGGNQIGVDFEDPILKQTLELSLASFGTRQVLAIITQVFWSEKGDTIMIEEPETSLHPESQVALQELFAEAVKQGKQIICSTHSPFFILAISRIIKKELLTLDQIAVYHVEKTQKGTQVKPLEFNKHGFIISGVPSFIKVEEELFRDWSESLEEE
jgi:predicted ATPase